MILTTFASLSPSDDNGASLELPIASCSFGNPDPRKVCSTNSRLNPPPPAEVPLPSCDSGSHAGNCTSRPLSQKFPASRRFQRAAAAASGCAALQIHPTPRRLAKSACIAAPQWIASVAAHVPNDVFFRAAGSRKGHRSASA